MDTKLKITKVANSLAVTAAIVYLVCIFAVWIAPGLTATLGSYLFHGIDINNLVVTRSFSYSLVSLITGTIISWLIGALFAMVYNKFR
ncbi:hypothetical protein J4426_01950 [Candidatus Woesearchaeota archaeon]|nr:hypothetical protein [Candidatus Woesearchaeota archaeon]